MAFCSTKFLGEGQDDDVIGQIRHSVEIARRRCERSLQSHRRAPVERVEDRNPVSVRLTIAAGLDERSAYPDGTDLLIDLGSAEHAHDPGQQKSETGSLPFIHPKANSVIRPSDGIGRSVFPVSGGERETAEDTLRVIGWRPSIDPDAYSSSVPASPDLEWLLRTLAGSDLPTVICTPTWDQTSCSATIAALASSIANHGHVVAWLSSHAGPTTCSLRAGIAIILFDVFAGREKGGPAAGSILGMLEIGERLSLGLSHVNAASIDMPLCPPSDRWQAALSPCLG